MSYLFSNFYLPHMNLAIGPINGQIECLRDCDAWPVRRQSDLRLPSHLQSTVDVINVLPLCQIADG